MPLPCNPFHTKEEFFTFLDPGCLFSREQDPCRLMDSLLPALLMFGRDPGVRVRLYDLFMMDDRGESLRRSPIHSCLGIYINLIFGDRAGADTLYQRALLIADSRIKAWIPCFYTSLLIFFSFIPEAVHCIEDIRDPGAGSSTLFYILGCCCQARGCFEQAVDAYTMCLHAMPGTSRELLRAMVYEGLGDCRVRQKQYRTGIQLYEQAYRETPSKELSRKLIETGWCCHSTGAIERDLEEYGASFGRDEFYHTTLGMIVKNRGDEKQARDHFLTALELQPCYSHALEELSSSYLDEGVYGKAVYYIELAVLADDACAALWHQMGEVYKALGNESRALQAFKQANTLEPGSDAYWMSYSDTLYRASEDEPEIYTWEIPGKTDR
jgi:tetratricopeptide (TPR) repeat protein